MEALFKKACLLLLSLSLAACAGQGMQPSPLSKSSGSGQVGKLDVSGGIGPGRMDIAMGDAPPWFSGRTLTHFYIGVREIDAIANGQSSTVLSMASPYVFDLLSYQDGNALDLGQASVVPANYTQLRFVLDVASAQATFSDGTSLPVTFLMNNGSNGNRPGASTITTADPNIQGAVDVTVNGSFTVGSGESDSFGVDFNALESTALVNNNAMKVRPSLVVATNASAGKITGNVVNQSGAPVQNAVVAAVAADGTIVNTALTGPYGRFNIHHLNAGSYQVVIYNSYTTAGGQSYAASGETSNAASVNGPTVTVTGGAATAAGALAD